MQIILHVVGHYVERLIFSRRCSHENKICFKNSSIKYFYPIQAQHRRGSFDREAVWGAELFRIANNQA